MKNRLASILAVICILLFAFATTARGATQSQPQYWKLNSNILTPVNSAWGISAPSTRPVTAPFFTAAATTSTSTYAGAIALGTTNAASSTHDITFQTGSRGFALYNTINQATDYERATGLWTGNTFAISTERGGSGSGRTLVFNGAGGSGSGATTLSLNRSTAPFFNVTNGTASSVTGNMYQFNPLQSAASGSQVGLAISPTYTQSGTAGYTGLSILPTETSLGSGTKALLQVGTSTNTSMLFVTNLGRIGLGTTTPTSQLQVFNTSTSTISLDSNSATRGSCIEMKDRDGSGYTYITANNGVLTESTVSCK